MTLSQRRYGTYAWFVLGFTVFVILWGAIVRATGSGAGCGNHWPTCNGQIIPQPKVIATVIEFTHRITSALSGLLTIGMVVWAMRAFPKGHLARRGARLSLAFMIFEGFLGAMLVRLDLVADNASVARAVAMGIHLINTMILLGVITLAGWWARGGQGLAFGGHGVLGWLIYAGLIGMLSLSALGAVTALGDTLFPAETLRAGLTQDLDPLSHFLIRLRMWHPLLSVALGLYLLAISRSVLHQRPTPIIRQLTMVVALIFVVQLAVGGMNIVLLAPVPIQLAHLLLADLLWITLVLIAIEAFARGEAAVAARGVVGALAPRR